MLLLAVKGSDMKNHNAVDCASVAKHLDEATHMQIILATLIYVYEVITVDMKAGALGVAVHWSMKSDSRAVCLRFGPQTAGSGANAPWSHPIEASFPGGVDRHVAIPVQPPQPFETARPGDSSAYLSMCIDAFSATACSVHSPSIQCNLACLSSCA